MIYITLPCGHLAAVNNEWMPATCVNISGCQKHEWTGVAKQRRCDVSFQSESNHPQVMDYLGITVQCKTIHEPK